MSVRFNLVEQYLAKAGSSGLSGRQAMPGGLNPARLSLERPRAPTDAYVEDYLLTY